MEKAAGTALWWEKTMYCPLPMQCTAYLTAVLADEIRVYPGRDGASIALGPYYGGQVSYFEVDPDGDGTLFQQDSEEDLAIIGFDLSFGTLTGWFGLEPDDLKSVLKK
jgi:hypothetical protein